MDTLQFTRGVTPLDIEMFGFLFPLCDQEVLADLERNNMEFSDLKAYGESMGTKVGWWSMQATSSPMKSVVFPASFWVST